MRDHYHFLTGQLAQAALHKVVEPLAKAADFDYSIQALPITVAALITPKWAARRIEVPPEATCVMLPGYSLGDTAPLEEAAGRPVVRGPKDLEQLPEFFGSLPDLSDYGDYDIQLIAQIRDASRLPPEELLWQTRRLSEGGADLVALGCPPGEPWADAARLVRAMRDEGRRVAIDSRNPAEVEAAVGAGAELVFSVDSANCRLAAGWGTEVVVVPDSPGTVTGLEQTVGFLAEAGVRFRVNPGMAPSGFGLAESIGRYLAIRWQWPEVEMLMDVGTVAELTQVDSAGVNVLLLGLCQELGVHSVVTNQEAPWTRSAVYECDLARQMVHYAAKHRLLPKQIEPRLLMLRDAKVYGRTVQEMLDLADLLKDASYRIFAEDGRLHAVAAGLYCDATDPYELFDQMVARGRQEMTPQYAFYMGYEVAKAVTALTLGKNYRQDESLDWGLLTIPELTRRERRALRTARRAAAEEPPQ